MGDKQTRTSNQFQYLIDFDYNEITYRRRLIFTDRFLEETDKFLLIDFASNAAESLLKIEEKLISEGEISHIRLYDKNENLLACKD